MTPTFTTVTIKGGSYIRPAPMPGIPEETVAYVKPNRANKREVPLSDMVRLAKENFVKKYPTSIEGIVYVLEGKYSYAVIALPPMDVPFEIRSDLAIKAPNGVIVKMEKVKTDDAQTVVGRFMQTAGQLLLLSPQALMVADTETMTVHEFINR